MVRSGIGLYSDAVYTILYFISGGDNYYIYWTGQVDKHRHANTQNLISEIIRVPAKLPAVPHEAAVPEPIY